MGYINRMNRLGLGCGPAEACVPRKCKGLCDDCSTPFVNGSGTKTRYPQKAIITTAGVFYNPIHPPYPDGVTHCGFCECFNTTCVAEFINPTNWYFPATSMPAGDFSFGGHGTSNCTGSYASTISGCPNRYLALDLETGYFCADDPSPGDIYLHRHLEIQTIGVPGDPPTLPIVSILVGGLFTISGELTGAIPTEIECPCKDIPGHIGETHPAVILPDSFVLDISDRAQFDLVTFGYGNECNAEGAYASVTFTDWIERDFPEPT